MKKISFALIFLVSFFLISCNDKENNKTDEIINDETVIESKINVSFNLNNEIKTITIKNNKTVSLSDVPFDNKDIEGLYYDKNFEKKYDSDVINSDITLYIKIKDDLFIISYVVGFSTKKVGYKNPTSISQKDVPFEDKDDIEGIYLDNYFNNPYDGEVIEKDITLYIKHKSVNYDKFVSVKLIGRDYSQSTFLYEGMIATNDLIVENFFPYSLMLEGIYYDDDYTREYDYAPIKTQTTLYLKTKETQFEVVYIIGNDKKEVLYDSEAALNYDDVPCKKDKIKGVFFDPNFEQEVDFENVWVSSNKTFYVRLEDIKITVIYDSKLFDETVTYGYQTTLNLLSEKYNLEYLKGAFYDSDFKYPYKGERLFADTTLYLAFYENVLEESKATILKEVLQEKVETDNLRICYYFGEYNGYTAVAFFNWKDPIDYNFIVEDMQFSSMGYYNVTICMFNDSGDCYSLGYVYNNGLLSKVDFVRLYDDYQIFYQSHIRFGF